MPGRILRAANLIPGPRTPATGLGPTPAAQTLTVPKYPGGIDDVGTGKTLEFADDSTVLVSLFTNFLAAVVESIQAEVGPIATNGRDPATWIAGHPSLMDMLDQVSLATVAGASRLVGLKRWSLTKIGWGGTIPLSADMGYRPPNVGKPAIWAYLNQSAGGRTLTEALTGPTIVRGDANWTSAGNIFAILVSAKAGNTNPGLGGAPTSLANFTVEGILLALPVGDPHR